MLDKFIYFYAIMYVQLESFFSLKFFQIHLELHFKSFYRQI